MPKKFIRPPNDLIKQWPEVFEDLYMSTIPVHYLEKLRLEFVNGRVWEIDIEEISSQDNVHLIAENVIDTFYEYQDEIIKIDFSINVGKLKQDISKSVFKILR
jgi:hypothetical protein